MGAVPSPAQRQFESQRITPGVGTTVCPERLGSPCTAKIPHSAPAVTGTPAISTYWPTPVPFSYPQVPMTPRAASSSSARQPRFQRFIGLESLLTPDSDAMMGDNATALNRRERRVRSSGATISELHLRLCEFRYHIHLCLCGHSGMSRCGQAAHQDDDSCSDASLPSSAWRMASN